MQALEHIAHSGSERADRMLKAKELLAVMEGYTYRESAYQASCRSRDSVSHLVARFNREGISALDGRSGECRKPSYGAAARARILAEVRRKP